MSDFIRLGVVSFAFGALLLLLALVGGGFSIRELTLSQLNQVTRGILGVLGLVFIGLGLWVTLQDESSGGLGTEARLYETPTPSVTTASSVTSSNPAGTTTTLEAFPTVAERELLAHVPENLREQCQRDDEPYEHTRASVECDPASGATTAWYMEYTKTDDMKKWYYDHIDDRNIKQDSGDCGTDQVEEYTYTIDDVTVGRYACYRSGGEIWMVWFHEKLRILALAYREDTNVARLEQWWLNAGPS